MSITNLIEINWPSREEWAKNMTTLYLDEVPAFDYCLSRYATPDEAGGVFLEAAPPLEFLFPSGAGEVISELKANYKAFGSKMAELKKAAGPIARQKGETKTAWIHRWTAMPPEKQEVASGPDDCQYSRKCINAALNRIHNGVLPMNSSNMGKTPKLDEVLSRAQAGHVADCAEASRKKSQTPTDDIVIIRG